MGAVIGRTIARDVLAEDMPRAWTGLDPQDTDQIPGITEGHWDLNVVERAAQTEYERIIKESETRSESDERDDPQNQLLPQRHDL